MKENSKTKSPYTEARAKWAKAQTELFLNALEQIGTGAGIKITPMMYVRAYKICIEEYRFGYPAEYKIAELISTDETYEQVLAIMSEVMKSFRRAFQREWKKQKGLKKNSAAHKEVA